jgi:plasmid stability protein
MMTNVTFSLPEETVERLRRRAAASGKGKGAISELVREALTRYLDSLEASVKGQTFTAFKGDEIVAKADSLKKLAGALEGRGVDPRSVRIISSEPLSPVGRMGLRARSG